MVRFRFDMHREIKTVLPNRSGKEGTKVRLKEKVTIPRGRIVTFIKKRYKVNSLYSNMIPAFSQVFIVD